MKITIIGVGGVGGYFGGKLAQSGDDVTFVARGETLKALKNKGLTVKSIKGGFIINPVKVVEKISDLDCPGLVLVCVKAWQVKDIARQLKPVIGKQTMVLPLQNGVLAAEELSEELGAEHVINGLCRILSKIEAPGVIDHFGVEPSIVFGEPDNRKSDRVLKIKDLFDKAMISSRIAEDINAEIWKKFISICISGLLAVTRSTHGQIREIKETRQMMVDLFNEAYELSQKAGINIDPDFVDKTVAFIDTLDYDTTASLTRDVMDGKPSEIEYQNGTVVKLAQKYGLQTPVNRFVYYSILPMEKKARKS